MIAVWIALYIVLFIAVYFGLLYTWFNAEERRDPFPHGWSLSLTILIPLGIFFLVIALFSKGMSKLWSR